MALLATGACSGSISCGSCGGSPLQPIPGGFDPAARIERAAQVRLSDSGAAFMEARFSDLVNAYARQSCGAVEDAPCPQAFGTSCDAARQICVDGGGTPQPVLGFEIEYTTQGSAIVCRDAPTDPNRRDCFAWLRLEGLDLTPAAPNRVRANVTTRLVSTVIPIRYANSILDLDCVVTLDSSAAGSPQQDIELVLELNRWTPPMGTPGDQLQVDVVEVNANIPDEDLAISGDPVHGGTGDALACGGLNAVGFLKAALISRLTDELGAIVEGQLDEMLGRPCGPQYVACPAGTTCNADQLCEHDGRVVPLELGLEGRADLTSLLGGLGGGSPGPTDVEFLVGGDSVADATGVTIGALGGAELVTLDPTCAMDLPSPRLRPTFAAPPPLPAEDLVDLDFDGAPETPYMVAGGLSEAFLDQVMWSLYGSGLFCQRIGAYDVDLLNTGSLGLLVPSLDQLTHADRYPWAVYPASLTLTPTTEPVLRLGSGEVDSSGASPALVDPLVEVVLDDVRVDLYAMLEERWMRLMTVQADITLGLGAVVNPANEVEVVLGDLTSAVSDVRVSNAELLAESEQELADAIPALIQLALPQITGAIPTIPLPGPAELGGFELQVLGLRGVESATPGLYPNLAVYADLDFFPALAGNLRAAADTTARVAALDVEPYAATLTLDVDGESPDGAPLEYQARVDGGLWSTFVRGPQVSLRRAALAVPGHHAVEVRARAQGDYRSLDPTPVVLDVLVDTEPPRLDVRATADGAGLQVRAADRVSREQVELTLVTEAGRRPLEPDGADRVAVPELAGAGRVSVEAVDEAGLVAEVLVREASGPVMVPRVEPTQGGCRAAAPSDLALWGLGLLGLFGLGLRRRR